MASLQEPYRLSVLGSGLGSGLGSRGLSRSPVSGFRPAGDGDGRDRRETNVQHGFLPVHPPNLGQGMRNGRKITANCR